MNSYLADAYPTQARARVFAWRNISDPLAQTVGVGIMTFIAAATHNWRWSTLVAVLGVPVALGVSRLREPAKGQNESSHILKAAGMDIASQQESAPKVLFGSAVTRIMRIRSLYFELVAVAILGFAGTGVPLFGSIYFNRVWHQGTGGIGRIYVIIGLAAFLGLPVAYFAGDRLFRRAPQRPLVLAAICITLYGGLFALSLYMPQLWMVVAFQFLANVAVAPLSISIFQTLAATAPPEMRSISFALFGVYGLVFGGFAGAVVLGAFTDAVGVTAALTLIGPVCAVGRPAAARRIALRAPRHHLGHRGRARTLRRRASAARRVGRSPRCRSTTSTSSTAPSRCCSTSTSRSPRARSWPSSAPTGRASRRLLRAVAGLDHPHRGVIRLFGANSTYLEPEQIIDLGVALLVGGKMTFPGLTVRDNLRVGRVLVPARPAPAGDEPR